MGFIETEPLRLGDIFYIEDKKEEMEAWYRVEDIRLDTGRDFDFYCRVIKENHKQSNYYCDHYRNKDDNTRDRSVIMITKEEFPEWYL